MFSNQRDSTLGLLILRQLLEDEFIEYPLPADKPHAQIFHTLEQNGYIERWDRFWPMTDRYRLTERGRQAIAGAYRPTLTAGILQQLQARRLPPHTRPQVLQQMGFDPSLWPILHDPQAHWMTWPQVIGPYQSYIWESSLQGAPAATPAPAPSSYVVRQVDRYTSHVDPFPAMYTYDTSYHGHHHHHESAWGGDPVEEPFRGGQGESGGGGASGSYDTDDLDRGGSGSSESSDGSSYGDVS